MDEQAKCPECGAEITDPESGCVTCNPSDDDEQSLPELVMARLVGGAPRDALVAELGGRGLDPDESEALVTDVEAALAEMAAAEAQMTDYSAKPLLKGAIGGLAAAILGGLVWAAILIVTDYEVGIIAWGIGWLAGVAVVICSGGRRGQSVQLIAVHCAIAGVLIGKFASVHWVIREMILQDEGIAVPLLDPNLLRMTAEMFFTFLTEILSLWDLLWFGLAILTAWRMAALQVGTRPRAT